LIGFKGFQSVGHGIPLQGRGRGKGWLERDRREEEVLGKLGKEDGVQGILICGVIVQSDVDPMMGEGRRGGDGNKVWKGREEILSSL
jgi:hypothetical protein